MSNTWYQMQHLLTKIQGHNVSRNNLGHERYTKEREMEIT